MISYFFLRTLVQYFTGKGFFELIGEWAVDMLWVFWEFMREKAWVDAILTPIQALIGGTDFYPFIHLAAYFIHPFIPLQLLIVVEAGLALLWIHALILRFICWVIVRLWGGGLG